MDPLDRVGTHPSDPRSLQACDPRVDPRNHFLDILRGRLGSGRLADRPALIFPNCAARLSFGALDSLACRVAAWLQAQGVEPGDRVALLTGEKHRFLAVHLGVLYAGGISLPLNPRFTREELRYFLADSGARAAIVGEAQRQLIESLREELPGLRMVASDAEAVSPSAAWTSYRDPNPGAEDGCLMLYSSGTTGQPKGVVHSHANLASSLGSLQECWGIGEEDVVTNVLPLFHIHGLSFATHLSWLAGACMRIEEAFHPRRTLDVVGQGTVFMAIPTFYYAFLDRPEFAEAARRWSSVRLFTCGSAPIRPEVLQDLEEILRRPVINRYGMTEAHVIASLPLGGPWPRGSVGLPLAGVELRVTATDGTPAAAGEAGTVSLRGPNLFREYWGRPEATRAAFAGGWFDTGDLGTLDSDGFLTLAGRTNDLIITSGFNVYPPVVERVINACPGVRESAVLGLPDRRRGERVVAVVVASKPGLDDRTLRAFCALHLVDYQRPHEYRLVAELPRNAMGKILRRELREDFDINDKNRNNH
jgi:malonyl-CoA/methylmalonyl-CoA synthetase